MIPEEISKSCNAIVETTKEELLNHFDKTVLANPDKPKILITVGYLQSIDAECDQIRMLSCYATDPESKEIADKVIDALEHWIAWIKEYTGVDVVFI